MTCFFRRLRQPERQVAEGGTRRSNLLSLALGLTVLLPPGFSTPVLAQVSAPGCLGTEPKGLGFTIDGAAAGDRTAGSISGAGDVNGDGLPDLIVGAASASPQGRYDAGRAYVVFGKANTTSVDLANLGSGGFTIDNAATGDSAGFSVSGAGDVNGDSIPDLLVGAPGVVPYGRVYVVFGKASTTTVDLANLGSGGFTIDGTAASERIGGLIASAGDVNGDGLSDLIVGAPAAAPQGKTLAGRAYVIFGKTNTAAVDLANLSEGGFMIDGAAANDRAGRSASAGDINGDGVPDLIVAASFASPQGRSNAGRTYVVFGKANIATVDLANLGSGGFTIDGAAADDQAGRSMSGVGDVNGDGVPDLIIGASGADPQGLPLAGRAYVVFGKANMAAVDLKDLGSGGFMIDGGSALDRAGFSVSGIGDVNGDGIPDLIVGAFGADSQGRSDAGRAYVVFGKANTATIDLANLGRGGFAIDGAAAYDAAGVSVAGAGDVNGDSIPDLLIGARDADPQGRSFAGRAYVVFGKRTDTNPIDLLNIQLSAAPDITAALRGATVTFTGNNLSSVSALTLGSVAVPFALNSSTRLTAVLPVNAPSGANTFSISTPRDGTVSFTNFAVLPTPAGSPTISSVTSTTGSIGTRVGLGGLNLAGSTVSFCNGVFASSRSSTTRQLFNVPSGATSGPVTVTTPNGSYNFLFTVPPSP